MNMINQPALSLQNLSKIYPNGTKALNQVSFDVERGDFFALLGPNGAGKSTTIGMITSLVNKTSGNIRVFGHDVTASPAAAKSCIGLVPQEFNFNIFETASDILVTQAGYYGISRKKALLRVEELLSSLGLWEQRNLRVRFLSGGMKRRLLIARALMHQPQLLILDEPTAGVDIELRRLLWDFLLKLNQSGVTVILTTHYLEEAEQLCRHIGIIHQGQLIEHTSMSELLSQLHIESFILYLSSPLPQSFELGSFQTRVVDEMTLEVDIQKNQDLSDIFEALSHLGINVHSMRNKVNRLEELFLRLTSQ